MNGTIAIRELTTHLLRNPEAKGAAAKRYGIREEHPDLHGAMVAHVRRMRLAGESDEVDKAMLAYGQLLLLDLPDQRADASAAAGKMAQEAKRKWFDVLPDGAPNDGHWRLLQASARCHQELRQFAGDSDASFDVRAAAWSSCFGADLHLGSKLWKVVRRLNVLLLGSTGTGKEILARAIQAGTLTASGTLPERPPNVINVAALPALLVESLLFGHVKGAFTGAAADVRGAIVRANKGSLFLDEVAHMPKTVQAKVLRAIENRLVLPLGAEAEVEADVRYVAATSGDPARLLLDLYHRLGGVVIRVPSLADRPEDVIPIADRYLAELDREADGVTFDRRGAVMQWLQGNPTYGWPGNVRELRSIVLNLVLDLRVPLAVGPRDTYTGSAPDDLPRGLIDRTWSEAALRHWYQEQVIQRSDGNMSAAARTLGLAPSTMSRRHGQRGTHGKPA